MSLNLATLLYLVASICFIQSLKGLSHPTTSIRGNVFGMTGMAIAALTTGALILRLFESYGIAPAVGLGWILLGLVVGGGYGTWRAKTVQMTAMPELVAFFHSMIGMAAVFIAVAAALTETPLGKTMGVLAVALAAVNVFGGFLVTRRMLEMFKKKDKKAAAPAEGTPK